MQNNNNEKKQYLRSQCSQEVQKKKIKVEVSFLLKNISKPKYKRTDEEPDTEDMPDLET